MDWICSDIETYMSLCACVPSKLPVQQNLKSDLEQELITFLSRPSSHLTQKLLQFQTASTLETFLSFSSSATLISISKVASLNSILIPLACSALRLAWDRGRRRKLGQRAVWGASPMSSTPSAIARPFSTGSQQMTRSQQHAEEVGDWRCGNELLTKTSSTRKCRFVLG